MMAMHNHFTALSEKYNQVRATDLDPISYICDVLGRHDPLQGADIGCGAGRYDLLLLQHLPALHLTCCDVNEHMLQQTTKYLVANHVHNFRTRQVDATSPFLPMNSLDCVFCFNAIHHFQPSSFLARCTDALRPGGHGFIYTRLRSQNEKSIWGRFFPMFNEKEARLFSLSDIENWTGDLHSLNLEEIRFFRFKRRASLAQLLDRARDKHYSTFSLFLPEEFRQSLSGFRENVLKHFPDSEHIQWTDQNTMLVFRKDAADHASFPGKPRHDDPLVSTS